MNFESMKLKIGWLYPTLMSTYGDRGNVICLQHRAWERKIEAYVTHLDQNASADEFQSVDLFVGGGAQDRQQEIVMRDLRGEKAHALRQQIEAGTPGVFTCGSPQLLGHYYEPAFGQRIEGLGLFDLVSEHPGAEAPRCIGNVAFEVSAFPIAEELKAMLGTTPIVIGFENHGGRTYLGEAECFGRVMRGYGNNGEDGKEGAFYRHAIATYSHGPLLPKNPFLADWLIQTALRQKYQTSVSLAQLDDSLAMSAREAMLKRLGLTTVGNTP
ncbi:MAG: cobalamin biosynthesis protein CobQ [Cyanobacteria bacterium QH_8_48_120]|jgi:CobQ-like glutamine amidotransferase family enzyme|nr:MAG: cobalamin biosynthesis protein CobQ [Cyanobacteria bacterium QH_10_48_56]PSO67705.1 MAG: cobalamin biosynthesis protein CobQ [Cyanobacteria bacterium QS_1_48_34]PSO72482.1 MAG: cobalamin biosynthesis protein CobQ [Cyanobacteria bacterium QH_8_48_120]PSO80441.1 MAG: cobalamin biosynthesis protein CobQ [Cyanobacteria bacterium QS_5_48_63]PSO82825.1 MAG: cobalamin biosynthesis protein CobQ [Cyanobacteria bacterium QH_9_48_43]PSO85624.1 MAG: cobalamin biosynthesis protein CobQ [Cyanobacter